MKISIVTISLNQREFLHQCIESVLSQTDVQLEYIVVDAGSTDGSREIIESYGNRLTAIFEGDEGPSDGLNKGFSLASGQIFGFINSDDFLLPGALVRVANFYQENSFVTFVSGSGFLEKPDGDRIAVVPSLMELRSSMYGACTVFQQGTFFPAKMFHSVGGFNPENRTCWDGELFRDFLGAGYIHRTIEEPLAVFRLHEGSISGSGRLEKEYRRDQKRIFRKIIGREYSIFDSVQTAYFRIRKKLTENRFDRKTSGY